MRIVQPPISTATVPYLSRGSFDQFGRQRFSQPETLYDAKALFNPLPLFWDEQELSGGGTGSVHNPNRASVTMSVTDATAGHRARQTKNWFNYQPGKSQLIIMTGVLGAGAVGLTKRLGLFNNQNGLYFQDSDDVVSVGKRSFATGTAVNTTVPQSAWNLDRLDGTGPSGLVLDKTKAQIFLIDFEWLGVGSVSFGFVIDQVLYYVHTMRHSNVIDSVYSSTPNLPLRYEIINDGTGPAGALESICSTVVSEGGQQARGLFLSATRNATALAASAVETKYCLFALRLKTTHLGVTVDPTTISTMALGANSYFQWSLDLNPTIAGALTYDSVASSGVEYALGATANTVTGGTTLYSGVAEPRANATLEGISTLRIGSNLAGVSDVLSLSILPVRGTNQSIVGSITWRELQ